MNQKVINKINILNDSPKYIDGISHVSDRNKVYDIAIAIYETKESLEDTKNYLSNNLSNNFIHRDKVLDDCIKAISIIYMFLDYYTKK